jgi:hypothetical protein
MLLLCARILLSAHITICKHAFGPKFGLIKRFYGYSEGEGYENMEISRNTGVGDISTSGALEVGWETPRSINIGQAPVLIALRPPRRYFIQKFIIVALVGGGGGQNKSTNTHVNTGRPAHTRTGHLNRPEGHEPRIRRNQWFGRRRRKCAGPRCLEC